MSKDVKQPAKAEKKDFFAKINAKIRSLREMAKQMKKEKRETQKRDRALDNAIKKFKRKPGTKTREAVNIAMTTYTTEGKK